MSQESRDKDQKKYMAELDKAQSFSRMVFDQFKKNRAALFGEIGRAHV